MVQPDERGVRDKMTNDAARLIEQVVGKPCSRKEVGRMRSLSLGFGELVPHKTGLIDKFYGEWELGTWRSAWRVVRGGVVLCGSTDAVDSIEEFNLALGQTEFGRFSSLRHLTDLDVRIEFDSGVAVDFLATTGDDDECFHVFCPGKLCIEFSVRRGWMIGPSDKPWSEGPDE